MESKFKKYESIANDNNSRTIDYYKAQGFTESNILWYATEKIHGTNFSFITDGINIAYAQRSGVIEDNFMNHKAFVHKISDKILELGKYFDQPIQVITEYYGKGIINKGAIDYTTDTEKHFIAYDILLLNDDKFVSYPENLALFDKLEIPYVKVIATGTFDELMDIDNHFESFLAESNNIKTYAEGMVLKPCKDMRVDTGERVILKRVSEQFAENKPGKVEKTIITIDESIIQCIDNKNTEIRLGKVAGKFGILPTEKSKFAQLIIELSNDIFEEMTQENIVVDINTIKKQLTQMVKSYFI